MIPARPIVALFLLLPAILGAASQRDLERYQRKSAVEWAAVLKDPDTSKRAEAVAALMAIAKPADAKQITPALRESLKDEQVGIRVRSGRVLTNIHAGLEKEIVPVMREAIGKTVGRTMWIEIAEVLVACGPAAKPAVPDLLQVRERVMGNDPQLTVAANKKFIEDLDRAIKAIQDAPEKR